MRPNHFQSLFWWPNENLLCHHRPCWNKASQHLLGIQELVKVKACATNTSDIRGHHDFKRVVIAKGGHRFRRVHGSERMGNPTLRISCSGSMRRAQGTLRGRGIRETQAADKKGGAFELRWISLQHDVMSTQQHGPSYPGSVKQASPPPSLFT